MASNYTENYGLCQWEAGDSFVRTEFNADNAKLDAALKDLEDTKAEQADVAALTTAVAGKAAQTALDALTDTVALKCRIKAGRYTGNGTEDGDSQTIQVGFPIQAVIVETQAGERAGRNDVVTGGLAVSGGPLTRFDYTLMRISGSSFTVYHLGENTVDQSGKVYYYIAFG